MSYPWKLPLWILSPRIQYPWIPLSSDGHLPQLATSLSHLGRDTLAWTSPLGDHCSPPSPSSSPTSHSKWATFLYPLTWVSRQDHLLVVPLSYCLYSHHRPTGHWWCHRCWGRSVCRLLSSLGSASVGPACWMAANPHHHTSPIRCLDCTRLECPLGCPSYAKAVTYSSFGPWWHLVNSNFTRPLRRPTLSAAAASLSACFRMTSMSLACSC